MSDEPPCASGEVRIGAVTKRFAVDDAHGTVTAVNDVSLIVESGEAVGIIGPNGAGKSTLLKLVAGVTAPSDGRIVRRGHTVAVIELGAGMSPDLTGRENMQLLLELASPVDTRRSGVRARLDRIVEFSGLRDVLDQPVRQYSTGMVARLAFSVAVHCDPQILLVDEVLSVGDIAFQEQCLDKLMSLRQEGCTTVMVTHDLGLVSRLCDRAVLIIAGEVEHDGPVEAVVRRYLGLQDRHPDHGDMVATIGSERIDSGSDLVVDLDLSRSAPATLRLEYLAPNPMAAEMQIPETVFGSVTLSDPPHGPVAIRLSTRGLPPGRYELRASAEDGHGVSTAACRRPFAIDGPAGPNAVRLWGEAFLDTSELGRF